MDMDRLGALLRRLLDPLGDKLLQAFLQDQNLSGSERVHGNQALGLSFRQPALQRVAPAFEDRGDLLHGEPNGRIGHNLVRGYLLSLPHSFLQKSRLARRGHYNRPFRKWAPWAPFVTKRLDGMFALEQNGPNGYTYSDEKFTWKGAEIT